MNHPKVEELIHHYYNAYNHKDVDKFLNTLTDDVIHDINQGSQEKGKALFRDFLKASFDCCTEKVYDIVIMVNKAGDRAAVEFMCDGVYEKSVKGFPQAHNQKYSLRCGAFFEIRNGKISRATIYYNFNEWLKQVKAQS